MNSFVGSGRRRRGSATAAGVFGALASGVAAFVAFVLSGSASDQGLIAWLASLVAVALIIGAVLAILGRDTVLLLVVTAAVLVGGVVSLLTDPGSDALWLPAIPCLPAVALLLVGSGLMRTSRAAVVDAPRPIDDTAPSGRLVPVRPGALVPPPIVSPSSAASEPASVIAAVLLLAAAALLGLLGFLLYLFDAFTPGRDSGPIAMFVLAGICAILGIVVLLRRSRQADQTGQHR